MAITHTHVTADELMQDDYFELGGEIYRVHETVNNDLGGKVIRFYHPSETPNGEKSLIVPKTTPFKIFNQGR